MKKTPMIVGIIIAFLVAAVFVYVRQQNKEEKSINYVPEPGVAIPDVNPVNKTNPYSDLKTNPFE